MDEQSIEHVEAQSPHDAKIAQLAESYESDAGVTAIGAIEKFQEIIIAIKTNELSFLAGMDLIREVSTTNLIALAIATKSVKSH